MDLREKWENPKVRKFAIALIIAVIAVMLFKSMQGNDKSESIQARLEKMRTEDRVDDKGRVKGLFANESLADISQENFEEVYEESVDELRTREKRLYTERDRINEKVDAQQQTIDELMLKIQDLERQQEIAAKASLDGLTARPSIPANQQRQQTVNSTSQQAYQAALTAKSQPDRRVFDRTPAQFVTAKPQIEGKVIRTITQRSVRSIKSDGVIEEKAQADMLITQDTQQQGLKDKAAKQRKGESEGGLVDSDEGVVYLPSGSFFSGVLLTGLDAPTQLAAKKAPMPVIIRVKKEAILPNHYTLDLRECHVIGESVGDLSSERAHIRAKNITCVRNDGKSVESAIQANAVSDYDGKLGIAGRLVSKNGNLLAGSMAAGFMSGISEAVSPRRSTSINTSPGSQDLWQSVDLASVGAAGVFQGSSDAMDRLAEYYIELAEQIHPVIEISPGRSVTFAVISGTKLNLGEAL